MRQRPSSRLLVLNPHGKILLFRFVFKQGALAGQDYWATPGGGLEDGETFEQAAMRELEEETGLCVEILGPQVGEREFVLQLPDGEHVLAQERFFIVYAHQEILSRHGWTLQEKDVIAEHKWWSENELSQTTSKVFPENLLTMLKAAIHHQV